MEGGGEGEAGGVEGFEVAEGVFEEVRGFPELGGFVHVLVEPLVAEREVERVDEEREMRVERSEKREEALEEREGDSVVVGDQRPLQLLHPPAHHRVEPTHGVSVRRRRRLH